MKVNITRVDEVNNNKTSFKNESPLPEGNRPDGCEGYSDVPNQFRLWIEYMGRGGKLIELHIIGYGWKPIENISSGIALTENELNEVLLPLSKIVNLSEMRNYGYRYTGDIALHSDNGSEFCT